MRQDDAVCVKCVGQRLRVYLKKAQEVGGQEVVELRLVDNDTDEI